MKCFLTSIGERTTEICKDQLEKYGFEVIVLAGQEAWYDKYKRFIFEAKEDCIRIDADVIVNQNVKLFKTQPTNKTLMAQAHTYDLYRNNIGVTSPVYYSAQALEIIRKNWDKIGKSRPETDASRLNDINAWLETYDWIVGIHGFGNSKEDLERHKRNKTDRKQLDQYDFTIAERILNL